MRILGESESLCEHRTEPGYTVERADVFDFLASLPDASVDLCITDPPYESMEKHRRGGKSRLMHSGGSSNDWFQIFSDGGYPRLLAALWRVLKRDAHLYVFCDFATLQTLLVANKEAMELCAGKAVSTKHLDIRQRGLFNLWKPVVWYKTGRIGMGYHYRASYELIAFFEKGKRRLRDLGMRDVLDCPQVLGGYPAEKPSELLRLLVKQSSVAGELVLDPFMGSGSTGEAACTLGRGFTGCDVAAGAVEWTLNRLSSL